MKIEEKLLFYFISFYFKKYKKVKREEGKIEEKFLFYGRVFFLEKIHRVSSEYRFEFYDFLRFFFFK